jgi:hypothetical protein
MNAFTRTARGFREAAICFLVAPFFIACVLARGHGGH